MYQRLMPESFRNFEDKSIQRRDDYLSRARIFRYVKIQCCSWKHHALYFFNTKEKVSQFPCVSIWCFLCLIIHQHFFFSLSLLDLKPLLLPTSSLKEKFKNPQITVNLNKYVFIFNFPNLIPPPPHQATKISFFPFRVKLLERMSLLLLFFTKHSVHDNLSSVLTTPLKLISSRI